MSNALAKFGKNFKGSAGDVDQLADKPKYPDLSDEVDVFGMDYSSPEPARLFSKDGQERTRWLRENVENPLLSVLGPGFSDFANNAGRAAWEISPGGDLQFANEGATQMLEADNWYDRAVGAGNMVAGGAAFLTPLTAAHMAPDATADLIKGGARKADDATDAAKAEIARFKADQEGALFPERPALTPAQPMTLDDFSGMASGGKVHQARTQAQDVEDIISGKMRGTTIDLRSGDPDLALDYEMGDLTTRLERAGLYVDDDRMGQLYIGKTAEDLAAIKAARTPYEMGKLFGYSDEDIAAFYLKRRGGEKNTAFDEYIADAQRSNPTLTPAQQKAQDILDLLGEGRGAEITDEMLVMPNGADQANFNSYLADNYDLPLDEASRNARFKEMGGDPDVVRYRGDAGDRNSFETGQFAREGIGVTSSSSPKVAATYMTGDSPAMYPLRTISRNPLEIDAKGRNWTGVQASAETNNGNLNDVLDPISYLDDENLFDFNAGTKADWGDGTTTDMAVSSTNDVSRAAQAQGFDEVRFNNIVDRGGSGKYHTGPANDPHTTVMTANPINIRSRFARMDPRLKHLKNLSAIATATGITLEQLLGEDRTGFPE